MAILLEVWWLEIRGRISCRMLSPKTTYGVYFVFNMRNDRDTGFDIDPVDAIVGILGTEAYRESVCLNPYLRNRRLRRTRALWLMGPPAGDTMLRLKQPRKRDDGWFEVELGVFENGEGDDEVEMAVMEVKGNTPKSGLVVEGIEIRPKPNPVVV